MRVRTYEGVYSFNDMFFQNGKSSNVKLGQGRSADLYAKPVPFFPLSAHWFVLNLWGFTRPFVIFFLFFCLFYSYYVHADKYK